MGQSMIYFSLAYPLKHITLITCLPQKQGERLMLYKCYPSIKPLSRRNPIRVCRNDATKQAASILLDALVHIDSSSTEFFVLELKHMDCSLFESNLRGGLD